MSGNNSIILKKKKSDLIPMLWIMLYESIRFIRSTKIQYFLKIK